MTMLRTISPAARIHRLAPAAASTSKAAASAPATFRQWEFRSRAGATLRMPTTKRVPLRSHHERSVGAPLLAGEDAVGKEVLGACSKNAPALIVGVVGDSEQDVVGSPAAPEPYEPYAARYASEYSGLAGHEVDQSL